MTEKELKRLSRADLLEMLVELKKENDNLTVQLESARNDLKDRKIKLSKAGSIAEAALRLNDVFEAADRAAAQYLENVRNAAPDKRAAVSADKLDLEREVIETKERCRRMLAETEAKCRRRELQTEERCQSIMKKMKAFCNANPGLADAMKRSAKGNDYNGKK